MKMLCGTLIGVVALLMVAPQAAAIPPSWDTQINDPSRFTVLSDFNDEAVLDKETGLVWDRSPNTNSRTWFLALVHCYRIEVGGARGRIGGGRKGWRLPTLEELTTLIDATQSNPALPSGHPFDNVQATIYWSATTNAFNTSHAWTVFLSNGDVHDGGKAGVHRVWCVRGGQGIDGVQ